MGDIGNIAGALLVIAAGWFYLTYSLNQFDFPFWISFFVGILGLLIIVASTRDKDDVEADRKLVEAKTAYYNALTEKIKNQ